jgi:hypothetical protein
MFGIAVVVWLLGVLTNILMFLRVGDCPAGVCPECRRASTLVLPTGGAPTA